MQYHPDRNNGDGSFELKFKEINEAYEILKDPQKRAAYDRFGHRAFEQGGGFAGAGASGFASFADIFDEFFGDFRAGGRRSARERGSDLRYNLEVTLEDAFAGKTVEVEVPTNVTCNLCSGSGAKPGTNPKTCPTCGGAGRVRATQGGFFHIERTCPACQGRGEVVADPCTKCAGAGRVSQTRTLSVNIPPGIEDGTRIRLAGEGEAGVRGGPPGDLYIFLSIKPHAFFQRDGADIFCRVPVSITTAALGGQFEVPTVDGGHTRVKVPEGSQTGRQFRLKSKGMPVLRSRQVGDMYVQIAVETPQNLSRRQRDLLEEFERASSEANNPESSGSFSRVKDFLETLGEK
jgi:molecular chaperone DnaJ